MIEVTVLGCGGSLGVPMSGDRWGDCDPNEPRNRRRRASILVRSATTAVLVDAGPDLREQLNEFRIRKLDAVVFTHAHADHVHGIDDLRPITFDQGAIPAYAEERTRADLDDRFAYAVDSRDVDRGLYRPILSMRRIDGPFTIGDIPFVPFTQDHGFLPSTGYRIGDFAYSTDVVALDDAAFEALAGVRSWIVDATREAPHPSHAHLSRTLEWIDRLGPERAWLTHMNHTMDYATLCRRLPDHIRPAHDGLTVPVSLEATAGA